MLSPKVQRMQRSIRINEGQLLGLAEKARYDSRLAGILHKRCADSNKWLLRWFRLYQVNSFSLISVLKKNLTYFGQNVICLFGSFSWLLSGCSWVRARRARELSWQFNFEKGKQKRRKSLQLFTKSRASFVGSYNLWFTFFQNLLFYYDSEQSLKPIGVIFLEGCFCERVMNPGTAAEKSVQNKLNSEKMVRKSHFWHDQKLLKFFLLKRKKNKENVKPFILHFSTASQLCIDVKTNGNMNWGLTLPQNVRLGLMA